MLQQSRNAVNNTNLVSLLRVTVEEQIGHNIPLAVTGDCATQTQDLTGQHPPHETNAVGRFVVAGDGNINKLCR